MNAKANPKTTEPIVLLQVSTPRPAWKVIGEGCYQRANMKGAE